MACEGCEGGVSHSRGGPQIDGQVGGTILEISSSPLQPWSRAANEERICVESQELMLLAESGLHFRELSNLQELYIIEKRREPHLITRTCL